MVKLTMHYAIMLSIAVVETAWWLPQIQMCGYMVWDCGKLAGLKINALLFKEELQENINLGARLIEDFSAFSIVPYPVSTVVAMYMLTGCDM